MTVNTLPLSRLAGRVKELRDATGGSINCGHMVDPVCWLLFGLVRWHRPDLVVQTGHLWGKSALVILEALSEDPMHDGGQGDGQYGAFVDGRTDARVNKPHLISIDPDPMAVPNRAAGSQLLNEWYPGMITEERTSSAEFFKSCPYVPKVRLFGVVDGDHTADGCRADLVALEDLAADVIVIDDTAWLPELRDVVRQFAIDSAYDLADFPYYNGLMVLQA